MKAARLYGKRDLRIEDIADPEIKPDEVLIKIMASGVCGTDVHIYHGNQGSSISRFPVVPGHEFSGIVVGMGAKVKGFEIGDRVCVDPNDYCGECRYCIRGSVHFCENLRDIGATEDGGFAQYGKARYKQLYKLANDVSFSEGAMAEPISCCLHAIDMCGISAGNAVLIIGGGPIGLIMMQLVKNSGASFAGVITRSTKNRELAMTLGADYVSAPKDEREIRMELLDRGVEHIASVIECVGKIETFEQAVKLADKQTTVMMFGLTGVGEKATIRPFEMFEKELTIKASFVNPFTMGRAVQIINNKRINLEKIINPPQPLENLEKILIDSAERRNGKVIIDPWL